MLRSPGQALGLLAMLESLVDELATLTDVIAGLVGELRRNPELADAMRRGYIDARRQTIRDAFARAAARGELAPDVDTDLIWQLAPATLFFRVLLADEPVDRDLARRLVDDVVLPLAGRR